MDYTLLELGPATSLVTNMLVTKWGSDILVSCIYDPLGSRRPYQLLFNDCREVRWEVIHPEGVEDAEADLIGFSISRQLACAGCACERGPLANHGDCSRTSGQVWHSSASAYR